MAGIVEWREQLVVDILHARDVAHAKWSAESKQRLVEWVAQRYCGRGERISGRWPRFVAYDGTRSAYVSGGFQHGIECGLVHQRSGKLAGRSVAVDLCKPLERKVKRGLLNPQIQEPLLHHHR